MTNSAHAARILSVLAWQAAYTDCKRCFIHFREPTSASRPKRGTSCPPSLASTTATIATWKAVLKALVESSGGLVSAKDKQLCALLFTLGCISLSEELRCGHGRVTPSQCQVIADFLAESYPDGFSVEKTWRGKARRIVFRCGAQPVLRRESKLEPLTCICLDDKGNFHLKFPQDDKCMT